MNNQEQLQATNALKHSGKGKIESPVLFKERDGIWLKLQGKARKTVWCKQVNEISHSGMTEPSRTIKDTDLRIRLRVRILKVLKDLSDGKKE